MRLKFKLEPEPEPGQSDGSGSSQVYPSPGGSGSEILVARIQEFVNQTTNNEYRYRYNIELFFYKPENAGFGFDPDLVNEADPTRFRVCNTSCYLLGLVWVIHQHSNFLQEEGYHLQLFAGLGHSLHFFS